MAKRPSPEQPAEPESTPSARPIYQSPIYGNISASLFRRQRQNNAGQDYADYDVSLSLSYMKDGERQFKNLSLKPREIMGAIQALTDAYRARYGSTTDRSGEEE